MYMVTVSNAQGCTDDDDVWVDVNPDVIVNLGDDITICGWEYLYLNAGAGYSSYLWSTGDTVSVIVVHFDNSMSYGPYTYYVDVWDELGCMGSDTVIVTFDPCIGISENSGHGDFEIYPNPNKGMFNMTLGNITGDVDMTIYNIQGQIVYREKLEGVVPNYNKQLDLSNQPKGVYYIKLMNHDYIGLKEVIIQ